MVLLVSLTGLLVIVFFLVLAVALVKISGVLRSIGGTPVSFLAKLRLGLRAIEQHTGHLAPQVTAVNAGLSQVAGGLAAVDQSLVGTINAVQRQKV